MNTKTDNLLTQVGSIDQYCDRLLSDDSSSIKDLLKKLSGLVIKIQNGDWLESLNKKATSMNNELKRLAKFKKDIKDNDVNAKRINSLFDL